MILRSLSLQWLIGRLFPALRAWPVRDWPTVMRKARQAEFDQFERVGIIAAVIVSAWVLNPAVSADIPFYLAFILQLLLSLPLLMLLAGPFFLRRIRRCLDAEAKTLQEAKANSFRERI